MTLDDLRTQFAALTIEQHPQQDGSTRIIVTCRCKGDGVAAHRFMMQPNVVDDATVESLAKHIRVHLRLEKGNDEQE